MTIKLYETERFYVRPFTSNDITEQYRQWFFDVEVIRYNSHGLFPYTKNQMEKFIESLESSDDLIWGIFTKFSPYGASLSGLHIGNVSLQRINWTYRSAEFAIVMGEKDYWDKGYGTEAAKMIISHGFNRLNLHRVWTGTASTNIGMQKIAEKLGMKKEGVFRDAMFLNGQYVDIFEYGLLQGELK